jgi:hypothetical protein
MEGYFSTCQSPQRAVVPVEEEEEEEEECIKIKQHFKITIKQLITDTGEKPFSSTIQGNVIFVSWSVW